MKKRILRFAAYLLTIMMLFHENGVLTLFAAGNKLDSVSDIKYVNNILRWNEIDHANNYVIKLYKLDDDKYVHVADQKVGNANYCFYRLYDNGPEYLVIEALSSNNDYESSLSEMFNMRENAVSDISGDIVEPSVEEADTENPSDDDYPDDWDDPIKDKEDPVVVIEPTTEQESSQVPNPTKTPEATKVPEPTSVPKPTNALESGNQPASVVTENSHNSANVESTNTTVVGTQSNLGSSLPVIYGTYFEPDGVVPIVSEIDGGYIGDYKVIYANVSKAKAVNATQLNKYAGKKVFFGAIVEPNFSVLMDMSRNQKIEADLRFAYKKVSLPMVSDKHTTFSFTPVKDSVLPVGTTLHFNVGKEYKDKRTYIFEISPDNKSYILKNTTKVSDIGNVAYETRNFTKILIMIE